VTVENGLLFSTPTIAIWLYNLKKPSLQSIKEYHVKEHLSRLLCDHAISTSVAINIVTITFSLILAKLASYPVPFLSFL